MVGGRVLRRQGQSAQAETRSVSPLLGGRDSSACKHCHRVNSRKEKVSTAAAGAAVEAATVAVSGVTSMTAALASCTAQPA